MNIVDTELPHIVAKLSGNKEQKNLKVIYSFVEGSHNLFVDQKEILSFQFKACENLLKETFSKIEKEIIQHEIHKLSNII